MQEPLCRITNANVILRSLIFCELGRKSGIPLYCPIILILFISALAEFSISLSSLASRTKIAKNRDTKTTCDEV